MKTGKTAVLIVLVLMLALCGSAAAEGQGDTVKTVTVSNTDGLIAAIAPDTTINLEEGCYNLCSASTYGRETGNSYCRWDYLGEDWYQLVITGADNLQLIGNSSEIVTEPRMANVLRFENSAYVVLDRLTVGHTEAADACNGGVLDFYDCKAPSVRGCSLYGCGTWGIEAWYCDLMNVRNTEIFNCSSSAIEYNGARGLEVENCSFYGIGSGEQYMSAWCAFFFQDASEITVKNCGISDCFLSNFLTGNNFSDVRFQNVDIRSNHIDCMFACSGSPEFRNVNLDDNVINEWFSPYDFYETSAVNVDGVQCDGNALTEKYGDQLSSAGRGTVEVEYRDVNRTGAKRIHVSTADEFLKAIDSDTVIYIDSDRIELTAASDYGEGWKFSDKKYYWGEGYDGFELRIGNVENFHICGGKIVTEPRYANVLSFYNCRNISLEDVRLGHNPSPAFCTGGVLYLEGCEGITVDRCDLYGCGILGVTTQRVSDLQVQDTVIHDCTYGAAELDNTDGAVFIGCTVRNCPEPSFTLMNCENFSWDGRVMDPYSSFNVGSEG